MGFFKRATSSSHHGQKAYMSESESFLTRAIRGGKSHAGTWVSESSALNFSAVYACHRILAETFAHPPLIVYEREKNGDVKHATDLEIYWALKNQFNKHMTSYVGREIVMHHIQGWGNGFYEIQRTRGREPVALWPMLPDRTEPEMHNGNLTYYTTVEGKRSRVAFQNVAHIPGLGFDGYKGYSPIQMQRQAIGLGLATEEFGAKWFGQGSKGGGVLIHPSKLSENAQENIRESFEDDNAGLDNAHRITILEEGMKFVPTTIPPNDAQFLETRKFQVVEIARFYRMQLHKLQEMDRATFSNIEQQAIEFVMDTMLPWYVKFEQELNRKLWVTRELRERYFVKFNLNSLLRGDSETRADFYSKMVTNGIMTRNEARKLEDWNELPGLDEPLVPLNMGSAAGDKLPDEKAMAMLEAVRMVAKDEPGAIGALKNLIGDENGRDSDRA